MTVDEKFPRALHELESEFSDLATEIPDGPEKKAISVLHGIVMEVWRNLERDRSPLVEQGLTVNDIAQLWKGAPAMEAEAVAEGLPAGVEAPDFELRGVRGR